LTKNPFYKKSSTYKAKDFYWIFGVEGEGRLSPFKTETPKRLKKTRF
jgi:hypothetical protein